MSYLLHKSHIAWQVRLVFAIIFTWKLTPLQHQAQKCCKSLQNLASLLVCLHQHMLARCVLIPRDFVCAKITCATLGYSLYVKIFSQDHSLKHVWQIMLCFSGFPCIMNCFFFSNNILQVFRYTSLSDHWLKLNCATSSPRHRSIGELSRYLGIHGTDTFRWSSKRRLGIIACLDSSDTAWRARSGVAWVK